MAARRSWTGSITVFPGTPGVPVEAMPCVKSAKGSGPTKDLCACHNLPIDRSHRCPETMEAPSGRVKGVERPDGSWAVVSEGDLETVKAQVESDEFEPLAYKPRSEVALEQAQATYNLQTPKKTPGFKSYLRALYDLLEQDQSVLLGRITLGTRQRIVAVYTRGDEVVRMAALAYADEAYEPPAGARVNGEPAAVPELIEMWHNLAERNGDSFDITNYTDEAERLKGELAARIVGGPATPPTSPTPAPESEPAAPAPDLMAELKAAYQPAPADAVTVPEPSNAEVKA